MTRILNEEQREEVGGETDKERERENERKGGAERKREGGNNESNTLRDTIAPQI